jgi:NAD-dependent dihydropyrimidine dehydrogenase PreA subunit
MYVIKIDKDKCQGCGECVDICPSEVLEMVDEKANQANPDECAGCESCVEVCKEGAITISEM